MQAIEKTKCPTYDSPLDVAAKQIVAPPVTMLEALEALMAVATAHRDLRKAIAKHSVAFFASYYLGITLADHQVNWANKVIKTSRGLIIAPVGHGKTELISKVLALWVIANNKNARILLLGETERTAIKNLNVIKYELRYNKRLIADYGVFYSSRNKWDASAIEVVRHKNLKDYSFQAVGATGAITGGRFDYIIADDLIGRLSALKAEVREKTFENFQSTIKTRLEPDGIIWLIGTRKHFDDIYGRLIKNPLWTVIHDRAIIREPADWEMVKLEKPIIRPNGTEQYFIPVIHGEDRGECLWPEMRPMELLLLERMDNGTIVFSREWQGDVVDDETTSFRIQWLENCRDEGRSYIAGAIPKEVRDQYRVIVLGMDPSLVTSEKRAEARDTDNFVGALIGLRKDSPKHDLLGLYLHRGLTPDATQKRVKVIHDNTLPHYFAIETNSFGEIVRWNLIHKMDLGRLIEHKTGKNKSDLYEGVPMLSPLFENGMISLPYKTAEDKALTDMLIKEFHGLGVEPHDDIVMATWIAETLIQRYLVGQARIEKQRGRAAGTAK